MIDPAFLRQAYQAASLVTQLAIITALGTFSGNYLDHWLGTEPWLLLTLSALGFAAGMLHFFRGMARLQDHDDQPPDNADG